MPVCVDLTGRVFGQLTVLERAGSDARGRALWRCRCVCGNNTIAATRSLKDGNKKSCGCLHHKSNIIYVLGDVSICLMENRAGYLGYFWFDTAQIDIVEKYHWQEDKDGYAISPKGQRRSVRFHRLALGLTLGDGLLVDHINGDVRDNRRCNLRRCNHAENSRHRRGVKGYRKTAFGTYQATILIDGKRVTLGCYDTSEEAQACYDGAARIAYGKFCPPTKSVEIFFLR